MVSNCFKSLRWFYRQESPLNHDNLLSPTQKAESVFSQSDPLNASIRSQTSINHLNNISNSSSFNQAALPRDLIETLAPILSTNYHDAHYFLNETVCHDTAKRVYDHFKESSAPEEVFSSFLDKSQKPGGIILNALVQGSCPKVFVIHVGYCDIAKEKSSIQHSLLIKRNAEGFQIFQSFASIYSLREFLTGIPELKWKREDSNTQKHFYTHELTLNELSTLKDKSFIDIDDSLLAIRQHGMIKRLTNFSSQWGQGKILTTQEIKKFISLIEEMGQFAENNDIHSANEIACTIFGTEAFPIMDKGDRLNWKTGYPLFVKIQASLLANF